MIFLLIMKIIDLLKKEYHGFGIIYIVGFIVVTILKYGTYVSHGPQRVKLPDKNNIQRPTYIKINIFVLCILTFKINYLRFLKMFNGCT